MSRRKVHPGAANVAVAYLRLSPRGHGEDDPKLGLDAQRGSIEAWAGREGVRVVSWHVDDEISGDVPPAERAGLVEAMQAIERSGAGVLVVSKRDRLARDVVVAALVERFAAKSGAVVRSTDGLSDMAGPEGEFTRVVVDAAAQYERALIRRRTREALAVKRAKGEVLGGIPYGFQRSSDGKRLEANVQEQHVILRARELHASGKSLRAVAEALTVENLRSRAGTPFSHVQVGKLVRARDGLGRRVEP